MNFYSQEEYDEWQEQLERIREQRENEQLNRSEETYSPYRGY